MTEKNLLTGIMGFPAYLSIYLSAYNQMTLQVGGASTRLMRKLGTLMDADASVYTLKD